MKHRVINRDKIVEAYYIPVKAHNDSIKYKIVLVVGYLPTGEEIQITTVKSDINTCENFINSLNFVKI